MTSEDKLRPSADLLQASISWASAPVMKSDGQRTELQPTATCVQATDFCRSMQACSMTSEEDQGLRPSADLLQALTSPASAQAMKSDGQRTQQRRAKDYFESFEPTLHFTN